MAASLASPVPDAASSLAFASASSSFPTSKSAAAMVPSPTSCKLAAILMSAAQHS
eukprot:CAMPEP_0179283330 /NCGR_PEP_ID=MMETSP0797-20121207/38122_1 /TAXON_ID=47934 /ORGANISM="Dinophysis acuminata, Strain DAEP01" /LENGTH=54 /DNA_ID=CAMNT_0020992083 /DNA_START=127 /DNA_END=291 /DNA_ORIENTATION=-